MTLVVHLSSPPRQGARRRRARAAAGVVLAVLAVSLSGTARAEVARDPFDQREVEEMRAEDAQATALLVQGEALAAAGHLEEALPLFRQTAKALPSNALPHRRICETLVALGRGSEGAHDCFVGAQVLRTPTAMRAVVRALLGGPAPPSAEHLVEALTLLKAERRRAPNKFELSSALCDVAERIGDAAMLQECAEELVGMAPRAKETRQVLDRLSSTCPPWRFWTGWLALAAALLVTALHGLRRRFGAANRRRVPPALAAATILGVGVLSAGQAAAQPLAKLAPRADQMLGKWPINEADPESSVPSEEDRNKDPLSFGYWLQDMIYRAEKAEKAKDHEAAIKYYRALIKAVPDRAVGYNHLCAQYEATGDLDKAIATCGGALLYEGVTFKDYAHYVHLVIAKPGGVPSNLQKSVHEVLEHLSADASAHPFEDELRCEFGAHTGNLADLHECVPVLVAKSPNDLQTIHFQWALAMREGKLDAARQVIDLAQKAGMPEAGLKGLRTALRAAQVRRWEGVGLGVLAAALLAAGAVFGLRSLRRRGPPQPPEAPTEPTEPAAPTATTA